jgi:Uma2 family endonuclease
MFVTPPPYDDDVDTMILLTADEYLATGDDRPRPTELINGEVIVNSPTLRHQRIAARIRFLISLWCEAEPGRGESPDSVDATLDSGNVFAADVIWLASSHSPTGDVATLIGPPDLAVEVRSVSTWRFDIGTKKDSYERAGLPELWLVDSAAHTILVFRRSALSVALFDVALEVGAGEILTSPLLPGFALDVAALFTFADRS